MSNTVGSQQPMLQAVCPWCLSGQATLLHKKAGYTYRCDLCLARGPLATTPNLALQLWNEGLQDRRGAPLRMLYEALSALHRHGACSNPEDCRTPGCTHPAARVHAFLLQATCQSSAITLAELEKARISRLLADVRLADTEQNRLRAAEADTEYARLAAQLAPASITRDDFVRWRLVPDDYSRMVRAPAPEDFLAEVSIRCGYTPDRIVGLERERQLNFYRKAAIWLIRRYARTSLLELKRLFRRNKHTLLYSIRSIDRMQDESQAVRSLLTELAAKACHRAFAPHSL